MRLGKGKKNTKKTTRKKKSNYFFFAGYFLAFFAFSFRNWFDSLEMEVSGGGVRGGGNFEREHRSLLFLFIFPLILRPGILFPFFSIFFPYFLSVSFIHGYFNSCIGKVQLIYTFAFSSLSYNLACFFYSSSLYNHLTRFSVCFF